MTMSRRDAPDVGPQVANAAANARRRRGCVLCHTDGHITRPEASLPI